MLNQSVFLMVQAWSRIGRHSDGLRLMELPAICSSFLSIFYIIFKSSYFGFWKQKGKVLYLHLALFCLHHYTQRWAPEMEKTERQPTETIHSKHSWHDNRHPTSRYKRQPPTTTPDSLRSALDNLQQTTNERHNCQSTPTTNNRHPTTNKG